MTILLLSLVALCIVSLLAGWLRNCLNRRRLARGEISEMPTIQHVRPDDVPGWVRSLQLRGIELPAPVKEEAILFYE